MLLTPAVDGVAKTLSAEQTPMMIAFLRYFAAGLVALAVAGATRRRIVVPPGDRAGQLVRTALIMAAMTSLIAALGMVPIAKAVGGFLIAPIVSGLLGILVWREPPTVPRLAGSAIGCLGAAILLRPEAGLEPGCLFALLGGALLGAYLAATRGARSQTDALSTLAVQSLLGSALLAPFAFAGGLPVIGPDLLVGALALGCDLGGLPLPDRRRLPARRRVGAGALPLLQSRRPRWRSVSSGSARSLSWTSLVGLLSIALGGLVALISADRLTLPALAFRRIGAA